MTQNLRVKWILGLVSANAVIACVALGLGLHQYRSLRGEAETAREQLRAAELDVAGYKASLASRPTSCPSPAAAPAQDPQLTQTLQVIAAGQQALILRALQQSEPPKAEPEKISLEKPKLRKVSARSAPRKWRRPAQTCK